MKYPWTVQIGKASDADRDEVARLLRLAEGLEPKIRDAVIEQLEAAEGRVDFKRVTQLLEAGRPQEAITLVQRALASPNQNPLGEAITDAMMTAGTAMARRLPGLGRAEWKFGEMNPAVVRRIAEYPFDLIREMTKDQRAAIADVVRAGVKAGRGPLAVAQDIRDVGLKLTRQQAAAVMNYRQMLERGSRDALQRALRDTNFDAKVLRALAANKPLPQKTIDTMVERYRRRMLKYRSEMIARTEAMRAANAGSHAAWQEAVAEGKYAESEVRRRWWHSHDKKVRSSHIQIPIINADGVGLNEPFESPLGPLMYPGDPSGTPANTIHCRCTAIYRYVPGKT